MLGVVILNVVVLSAVVPLRERVRERGRERKSERERERERRSMESKAARIGNRPKSFTATLSMLI
jgi:hypothetical protein